MTEELNLKVSIDSTQFRKDVEVIKNEFVNAALEIKKTVSEDYSILSQIINKSLLSSNIALKEFIVELIHLSNECKKLESSFSVLVQSKEDAMALVAMIVKTASESPLSLSELAESTEQLLAFGVQAEEINDILLRLGNIAVGTDLSLNGLTSFYTNAMLQEGLSTNVLTQFASVSTLILQELARLYEMNTDEINKLVDAGKIGFPEVQKAIESLTNEGREFYDLMGQISQTLIMKVNDLSQVWKNMQQDVVKLNNGVASDSKQEGQFLIEHFEKIGKTITDSISSFGIARTALLSYDLIINKTSFSQALLNVGIEKTTIAQLKLIKAFMNSPIAIPIIAYGAFIAILWSLYDSTTEAEKIQKQYNKTKEIAVQKEQEHRQKIENLISVIENETMAISDRETAISAINKIYPDLIEKYIDEEGHLTNLIELKKELNEKESEDRIEKNKVQLTSINAKVKNQEEYVTKMSGSDDAISAEYDKLQELKKQQREMQHLVNVDFLNKLIKDSRGVSSEELKKTILIYEDLLSTTSGDFNEFTREEIQSFLDSLKQIQAARDKIVHNKSYWEKQKQDAQIALDAIDSKQRKLLDEGQFDKVDTKMVAYYKMQNQQLMEAEKELKIYDKTSKKEYHANRLEKNTLPIENETQLKTSIKGVESNNYDIEQEKEKLNKLLTQYQNFADQRLAIENKFTEDAKLLRSKRTADNAEQVNRALEELNKKKKEALASNSLMEFKNNINFIDTFDELDNFSIDILENLRNKFRTFIASIDKDLSSIELQGLLESLQKIDLKLANKNAFSEFRNNLKEYKKITSELKIVQQNLVDVQEGKSIPLMTRYDAETGKIVTILLTQEEAEKRLMQTQSRRASSLEKMNVSFHTGVGQAQEYLDIASSITDTLGNLGIDVPEEITGVIEGLGNALNSLAEIDLMKPMSIIKGVIGAIGGIGKAIGSLFNRDGKKEKNIQQLQKQIDVLDASYEKLGKSIENAYSQDASNMINQQNEMLEQQKVLIQNQIAEEKDKKHSDSDKIEAWQQQLEDIDNVITDNKVKAQDAIFGADVKSAIDDFANAYAEAWASGEDRASSMKDVVKKMIKGVIIEMLKDNFAPTVQKIRNKIEEALKDGVISDYEQGELDQMIEEITQKADGKYAWADKYMKDGEGSASALQSSASGGFEKMSQDTADELNGRFTALQMIGEEMRMLFLQQSPLVAQMSLDMDVIKLYTQTISTDVTEMKDIALTSMNHLSAIEKNTKHLQFMREDLSKIKEIVNNL